MKRTKRFLSILLAVLLLALPSGCALRPGTVHPDDADSVFLNIRPAWSMFSLKNAEGETLEWDTREMTGTMEYWDIMLTAGSSDGLLLRVPASETLEFTPNEYDVELSISTPTQWCYVEGWAITSLMIESSRISLKMPEENPLYLVHRINDSASGYLNESSFPYVFLNSTLTAGEVTMTPSPTGYTVEGIRGDYALGSAYDLQTAYSPETSYIMHPVVPKGGSIDRTEGVAEAGDVISLPIAGSGQVDASNPASSEESLLLDIVPNCPFRLENAEGEYLDFDGTDVTCTMEHWDARFTAGEPPEMLVRVPGSEAFTLTTEGEYSIFSISGHDQILYFSGTGITSMAVKEDHIFLKGNDMFYTLVHRIDDSGTDNILNSSLPYVRLDAQGDEAAITTSATDYTVEGLTGDYELRSIYSAYSYKEYGDVYTKKSGTAKAGEAITLPISGGSTSVEEETDSMYLNMDLFLPFHLENAEGETLEYDGSDLFGEMKHWDTGGDMISPLYTNVPASEALTFTFQGGKVRFSISDSDQWNHIEGTGITSVVVKDGCIILEGDFMDFDLVHRTGDSSSPYIAESRLPYVRLDAHAEGKVTMTASTTDFTVKGISGKYTLQTMYSKDEVLTREVGFAEARETISQPISGR